MLPYFLPRKIGSQPINFGAVVPYEENQIFCRKVSRIPSICQCTRLYDLKCKGQPQGRGKRNGVVQARRADSG